MEPATEAAQAALVVKVPGGFVSNDPRRWNHGNTPARTLEIRRLMSEDVPEARKRLLELLKSEDEQIAMQAVALAYAYGIGKPRMAPEDIEAILHDQFSDAFAKLGERLPAAIFQQVLDALKK